MALGLRRAVAEEGLASSGPSRFILVSWMYGCWSLRGGRSWAEVPRGWGRGVMLSQRLERATSLIFLLHSTAEKDRIARADPASQGPPSARAHLPDGREEHPRTPGSLTLLPSTTRGAIRSHMAPLHAQERPRSRPRLHLWMPWPGPLFPRGLSSAVQLSRACPRRI